jgi:hypothetical protein
MADWVQTYRGPYKAISGRIAILSAKALVPDWEPGGRDATWVAQVEGETSVIYGLGCQIRAIHRHAEIAQSDSVNPNLLVVE